MTTVSDTTHTEVPTAVDPLRAVDPLIIEATGGGFLVSSPRCAQRLRVEPHIVELLVAARNGLGDTWFRPDTDGPIRLLTEYGFLVTENPPPPSPWDIWGNTAWAFHQRVRDTPFIDNTSSVATGEYMEKVSRRPRPSSFRLRPDAPILLLPRVRTRCDVRYLDVVQSRRTHRHFDGEALDLDRFSDMLHYTFAPLRFADAGPLGVLQLKAAASGGARHECEAFVFVFDVDRVAPGLYAYDGVRHGLVPIDATVTSAHAERLTHGQGLFESAAFGVFTAAVADRMAWKYLNARAYKLMMHNVGHVAQVFSMTAAALGLGAAITGAIRDTEADRLLGLDMPREFTTFAMACGVPLVQADGLPLSIRVPSTAPETY
ncbi:SagB/ThcOx family dehydrogenase [Nocardia sp. NBC_01499]|uniref:SagB/ThcOx family dehydrogenase n=1 Tax=Nocardia sp. NBC_01499 TaxID=2903597 RepID=UPI003866476B